MENPFTKGEIMIKLHCSRIGFSGLFSSSGSALKNPKTEFKNQYIVLFFKFLIQYIEKPIVFLCIFFAILVLFFLYF